MNKNKHDTNMKLTLKRKSIDDIFKSTIENDPECYFINIQCKQDCYCEKDKNGFIKKICFNKEIIDHESNIYLKLLKSDICVLTTIINNEIIYTTTKLISLRTFLKKNPNHMSLIINEVFAFINSFKNYNFIHGNLHIDNIYIDIQKNYKFYVLDFCNSFIKEKENDENQFIHYKRKSYLNLSNFKNLQIKYLDFISLYISLNLFYENHTKYIKYIKYIQSIITIYIGQKYLIDCLNYYNTILNTEDYNHIKFKYNSF